MSDLIDELRMFADTTPDGTMFPLTLEQARSLVAENEALRVRVAELQARWTALYTTKADTFVAMPDRDILRALLVEAIKKARCADVNGWDFTEDAICDALLSGRQGGGDDVR